MRGFELIRGWAEHLGWLASHPLRSLAINGVSLALSATALVVATRSVRRARRTSAELANAPFPEEPAEGEVRACVSMPPGTCLVRGEPNPRAFFNAQAPGFLMAVFTTRPAEGDRLEERRCYEIVSDERGALTMHRVPGEELLAMLRGQSEAEASGA